jgi:hypothetical protein
MNRFLWIVILAQWRDLRASIVIATRKNSARSIIIDYGHEDERISRNYGDISMSGDKS